MSTLKNTFFIPPPDIPTQTESENIFYDFNGGARVLLPEGKWHICLLDADFDSTLFCCDADNGWVIGSKKYFVRFRIQVFRQGEEIPPLDEALKSKDRPVLISFPTGTLGNLLSWFPYAERFQTLHKCQLEYAVAQDIIDLLTPQYPQVQFSTPDNLRTVTPYATYRVGLYFGGDTDNQPVDFRKVDFHRSAGYTPGVGPCEPPVRLDLSASRVIQEPCMCIATQSTCRAKYWNNDTGWSEVVIHLKSLGYRVLCIDWDAHCGQDFVWNHIPWGTEDLTGKLLLQGRVSLLRRASFFIGLPNDLSQLTQATRIPMVLIGGFSLPNGKFYTPWWVFNPHDCYGCWDDTSLNFDHRDFLRCPRHEDTDQQFGCTRLIAGAQINDVINKPHRSLTEQGVGATLKKEVSNE